MNERPSLQFYPADWWRAFDVKGSSMCAQGVWFNLLMRMWDAPEQGKIRLSKEQFCRVLGCRPDELKEFFAVNNSLKFASVSFRSGKVTIINRRMHGEYKARMDVRKRVYRCREKKKQQGNGEVTPYSSTSTSSSIKEDKEIVTLTDFIQHWNSKPNLPKIQSATTERKRKFLARMSESVFAAKWQQIIDALSKSSFHTGKNDSGWRANVDWILKNETNYTKILEQQGTKNREQEAEERQKANMERAKHERAENAKRDFQEQLRDFSSERLAKMLVGNANIGRRPLIAEELKRRKEAEND